MRTLDEAIAHARDVVGERRVLATKFEAVDNINMCIKYAEEHEQLAEWLEELKEYKKKPEGWLWDEAERKGYNKAIYDFVAFTKEHEYKYGNADITSIVIGFNEFIAEQLKGGVSNENCV